MVSQVLQEIPKNEELLIGSFNITENLDLIERHWKHQKNVG